MSPIIIVPENLHNELNTVLYFFSFICPFIKLKNVYIGRLDYLLIFIKGEL